MKLFNRILIVLASVLALTGCVNDKDNPSGEIDLGPGDKLPKFSVLMNDGSTIDRAQLVGTPSLIVFFHTECRDCQKELPVLQEVFESYGDKIKFVGIGTGDTSDTLEKYWAENGLTFPYSQQDNRDVLHLFAPGTVPHIFISDRSGTIRYVHIDYPLATYDDMAKELNELLK